VETLITTDYITQCIARWLLTDDGLNGGGLAGMCRRADKEGLVTDDHIPERLCANCSDSFFCVSSIGKD
jgi:hypothetical protein